MLLALLTAVGVSACGNEQAGAGYARAGSGDVTYARPALSEAQFLPVVERATARAKSVHMVLHMEGESKAVVRGNVAYGRRSPVMDLRMSVADAPNGKVGIRYVGGKLYVQIPGVTEHGTFVKVDPRDKRSALAKSMAELGTQMDPSRNLRAMRSAVASADRVGKGMVGGEQVEHYRLTVQTAAIKKTLGEQARGVSLPETLPYDVWINQKNLIRRMTFSVAEVEVSMAFSKWGRPVKVPVPSQADIVTLPGV